MGIVSEAISTNMKFCLDKSREMIMILEEIEYNCEFFKQSHDKETFEKLELVKKTLQELKENFHSKFDRLI